MLMVCLEFFCSTPRINCIPPPLNNNFFLSEFYMILWGTAPLTPLPTVLYSYMYFVVCVMCILYITRRGTYVENKKLNTNKIEIYDSCIRGIGMISIYKGSNLNLLHHCIKRGISRLSS